MRSIPSLKLKSLLLLIFTFASCAHQPEYLATSKQLEINRYMGTWYVQAGRFTFLEKDVHEGIEKYTWNENEKRIDIDFTYHKGSLTGPLKSLPQKGWIVDTKTNTTWKVSPLWPFKFTYLILDFDPDYKWVAVGVPDKKYLWIMSREKQFPKERVDEILAGLKAAGYNVDNIVQVPQPK